MTVQDVATLLRDIGFPAFVSIWFMLRLEKRVDRLSELVSSSIHSTTVLVKSIDQMTDVSRQTGKYPALLSPGGGT